MLLQRCIAVFVSRNCIIFIRDKVLELSKLLCKLFSIILLHQNFDTWPVLWFLSVFIFLLCILISASFLFISFKFFICLYRTRKGNLRTRSNQSLTISFNGNLQRRPQKRLEGNRPLADLSYIFMVMLSSKCENTDRNWNYIFYDNNKK